MSYNCPFCAIVAGEAPAKVLARWPGVTVIEPLNPVTEGHALAIPNAHVPDAPSDPVVAAETFKVPAKFARHPNIGPCNLITSVGAEATQTVKHLHIHIVPRREDDGLARRGRARRSGALEP